MEYILLSKTTKKLNKQQIIIFVNYNSINDIIGNMVIILRYFQNMKINGILAE